MNPSGFGDLDFGVSTSNQAEPNSSFNTRPLPQSSAKTRPRFVKVRKHSTSHYLKPLRETGADYGYNPFRSYPGTTQTPGLGHTGLGFRKSGNEDFVFGAGRGNGDGDSVRGEEIVEELRGLKIGNANHNTSGIDESIKKLSIDDSVRLDKPKDKAIDAMLNFGANSGLGNLDNVSSEFKNKLNVREIDDAKTFLFSSKDGGSSNELPDRIRNLSIKEPVSSNRVENDKANAWTNHGTDNFVFGATIGSMNVSSNIVDRKLNVAKTAEANNVRICTAAHVSSSQVGAVHSETNDFSVKKVEESIRTQSNLRAAVDGNEDTGRPYPLGTWFSHLNSKQEIVGTQFVECKTPEVRRPIFSGLNHKPEFSAKRNGVRDATLKKRKDKFKHPIKLPFQPVQDSTYQEMLEGSESYSPMDVSPYRETHYDAQVSRQSSMDSDVFHDNKPFPNDVVDEDLAAATQRMDISGVDFECGAAKEDASCSRFGSISNADIHAEDSADTAETESFKSALEDLDSDNAVTSEETVAGSSSERQEDTGAMMQVLGSENLTGPNFTFAASLGGTQGQLSASKHEYRKKNRIQGAHDTYNSTGRSKVSCASSSIPFASLSEDSSVPSPDLDKRNIFSSPARDVGDKSRANRNQEIKKHTNSTPTTTVTTQEACEKWRLRGNQAYSSGNLSKAEDSYTQGVNCVPENETSRNCLKALMLCYSNRAATRMSLGRMREALGDCMRAIAIDSNFLKVQVRAANCYLALGEVEDASRHFKKCLQSGNDVCVDRKVALEASEGLQKVQKVYHSIQLSKDLLVRRTTKDAESALEMISEALIISLFSETLLEMRAEALLMLRRYEEVIQLCEQTIDSAERNFPHVGGDSQLTYADGSKVSTNLSFRLWRCHLMLKSLFNLGRLEEVITYFEKQEALGLIVRGSKSRSKTLESAVALTDTVCELLRHKAAGNESFQAGRHSEAIECYTVALSCNVESRPFAAICFCNRAAASKALGQITDAIADCSLSMALDGNYLKAISRRATLYESIRDYGQASTDLQRLVALLSKKLTEKANGGVLSNLENDLRHARFRLAAVEEEARKDIPLDMYLIFGVDPSVSALEIKKAYRKAALRHHPDKAVQLLARSGESGDDGIWKEIRDEVHKDADRLFKMIGEAYAVLSDPGKRYQYDVEEETRKQNGSSKFRSGPSENSRRPWRDVWRSYGQSTAKGPEFTWSNHRHH